jgi:hypothetical protein
VAGGGGRSVRDRVKLGEGRGEHGGDWLPALGLDPGGLRPYQGAGRDAMRPDPVDTAGLRPSSNPMPPQPETQVNRLCSFLPENQCPKLQEAIL